MFCCYGLLIIALGIVLVPTLGQAQEEPSSGRESAVEQLEVANALPVPFPVRIIEDDERARTRERDEAEARQREIDGLIAQQGMNAATQAMNEATQRMAYYSLLSTILVGLGTALLIWTLALTRQANKAARDAVTVTRELGISQIRAYLTVTPLTLVGFEEGQQPRAIYEVKNTGLSPARHIRIAAKLAFTDQQPDTFRARFRSDKSHSMSYLGGGSVKSNGYLFGGYNDKRKM